MAPHSSTLAWEIPWMEEPGRLQSMGSRESDLTERHHFDFSLSCTGEENGNPLQYCCLENPRDGNLVGCHLWVAQSQTRLTWLSNLGHECFVFKYLSIIILILLFVSSEPIIKIQINFMFLQVVIDLFSLLECTKQEIKTKLRIASLTPDTFCSVSEKS